MKQSRAWIEGERLGRKAWQERRQYPEPDPECDQDVRFWGIFDRPLPTDDEKAELRQAWSYGWNSEQQAFDRKNQAWEDNPTRRRIERAKPFIDEVYTDSQWSPSERLMTYLCIAFSNGDTSAAEQGINAKLDLAAERFRQGIPCNPFKLEAAKAKTP